MAPSLSEFSNELANAVERAGTSIVTVLEGGREGISGTIWREGVAVTAEHAIRGLDAVTVVTPSGGKVNAEVAGRDAGTDIAILRIPDSPQAASIGDDAKARTGELVFAIGRRHDEGVAATLGMISAVGGPWHTWRGSRIDRWLRLDLSPFSGFSGGVVVNASGEALGMSTSGPRRSFALIPSTTVNRVVDQLLKRGRVARGYLGVGLQPVAFPSGTVEVAGVQASGGLLVVSIAPGGGAENAGIVLGDIIVMVEGQTIRILHSLQAALSDHIGKSIALDLLRGGKIVRVSALVGESPEK